MRTKTARILHTTINIPFEKAYNFAREPENFPRWAAGLSVDQEDREGMGCRKPDGRGGDTFQRAECPWRAGSLGDTAWRTG
jgi:hypothetical protein